MDVQYIVWGVGGADLPAAGQGNVAGFFKLVNENDGLMKCREFLD